MWNCIGSVFFTALYRSVKLNTTASDLLALSQLHENARSETRRGSYSNPYGVNRYVNRVIWPQSIPECTVIHLCGFQERQCQDSQRVEEKTELWQCQSHGWCMSSVLPSAGVQTSSEHSRPPRYEHASPYWRVLTLLTCPGWYMILREAKHYCSLGYDYMTCMLPLVNI